MKKLLSVLSVFALAAIAAGTASAGQIATPTGLNPGDQFRIVFLSSTTTSATSSDLSTYDNIVSSDATGYTYGGTSPIWKAIVSNLTINARDHIGLQSTSLIPLFTVDGTKVSTGNLWNGSLMNPINRHIDGTAFPYASAVWTGTDPNTGAANLPGQYYMGDTPSVAYGDSTTTNYMWAMASVLSPSNGLSLYGISEVLAIPASVPEPSTVMLAGLGGLAALVYSFKRKRNLCRR